MGVLAPERRVLADKFESQGLGRLNDLLADKKGGVYFNGAGTFYVPAAASRVWARMRTNGIMLSRDERTLLRVGPAGA